MVIKTKALKGSIIIIGVLIISLFYLLVYGLISSVQVNSIYFEKILFYFSLYIALILSMISNIMVYKILLLIDKDILFTKRALKKIKLIKYLSIYISIVLLGIIPMVKHLVDMTGVSWVYSVTAVIVIAPLILSTFIGVLEKLLIKVLDIKSENDLTV